MGLGALTLASSRVLAQTRASIGWLTVAPHPGIQGFLTVCASLAGSKAP
jgi:hypothetical protein